jgi:endonuclease-8
VPEGDTILRAARTLDRWLRGREVTRAESRVADLPATRLVGRRVVGVDARGKHLLVRFDSGAVLHTHMRMTGSWHVYRAGERWRKRRDDARIVVEAGERVAVCFNAPVVELLAAGGERVHPALTKLGPDVLAEPLDLDQVRRRAGAQPPGLTVGELLLDQHVVSGIGNIYRCETLFCEGVSPWTPVAALGRGRLDAIVTTAATLMRRHVEHGYSTDRPLVYRRSGRPCYRCRRRIRSASLGAAPRTVYWCEGCQPPPPQDGSGRISGG